jgi:molybdopterin molybdotransferase
MAHELISVDEARDRVLARTARLSPEPVPIEDALGRVLAADATSADDVPGFDNSAMDGFAVRALDTAGAAAGAPVSLRVVDESRAGAPASCAVGEGEAVRISTGAALPEGGDSVIRLEEAEESNGSISFESAVAPGRDIRRAGEDVRAGDTVVGSGAVIGPAEAGVLVSIGAAEVSCTRKPRLSVVCTGDELLGPGDPMIPGGVRNSNAYTVPALALRAGAEVAGVERAADEPEATRAAVGRALDADVAVVCGGVSVGEHDHVKEAFAGLGVEEDFWGVALRPGRPTWFGVHRGGPAAGGSLVFGLPGNPVSAYVTFVLFVRPALRALSGAPEEIDRASATLATEVPRLPKRDQAVRCGLELTDGGWLARPTGPQGSHVLTSMLGADALAVIAAGPEAAAAGEEMEVELLRA